jgi:hypothetical protein
MNTSGNDSGMKMIDYLNGEVQGMFDLINQKMGDKNLTDLFDSWVFFPANGSSTSLSPFREVNVNQITNATTGGKLSRFADQFRREMTAYIRQTSTGMPQEMIERFNQFFKNGKIKIVRGSLDNIGTGMRRSSIGSIGSSKPRSRAGSVTGINVRTTLANTSSNMLGPFVIHYYPTPGPGSSEITIPFEFQTIISTEKITDETDRNIILAFINILRKYYVDRLIQIITQKVFYHCDKKTGVTTKCSVVAVGSVSLTSNYDVTVSGVIYPNRVVRMFNQEFAKFWRDYSSNVFDTNLYGSTFFVTMGADVQIDPDYSQLYRILQTPSQQVLYLPPEKILGQEYPDGMRQIRISQLKWLMVKVFLHQHVYAIPQGDLIFSICTVQVIDTIRKMILGSSIVPKNNPTSNATTAREAAIDQVFDEKFGGENSREEVIQSYDDKEVTMENYNNSLVQIQSSQLTYESIYRGSIKNGSSNSGEILRILMELIDNVSKSNFYGSETYFCMATIYHVLGYVQKLGDFALDREDYIISALENFIDIFRYYSKLVSDPPYAIIKMSKYVYRIYNALAILNKALYESKEMMWASILKEMKGQHSFNGNIGSRHLATLKGAYPGSGDLIPRILNGVASDLFQILA